MKRHRAAPGRVEIVAGERVEWCAFCSRDVVRRAMLRRYGPGLVYSRSASVLAHGSRRREPVR